MFFQNLSDSLELFSIYFGFSCTLLDSIGFFQNPSGFLLFFRSLSDSVGCSQIFSALDQILSFVAVFFRIVSVFFRILSESLQLFSDSLGFFGISLILLDSSEFFRIFENSLEFLILLILPDSFKFFGFSRIFWNSFEFSKIVFGFSRSL